MLLGPLAAAGGLAAVLLGAGALVGGAPFLAPPSAANLEAVLVDGAAGGGGLAGAPPALAPPTAVPFCCMALIRA